MCIITPLKVVCTPKNNNNVVMCIITPSRTARRAARSLAPREERRRALRGGAPPVMAGPVPFTPARGGSSVGARAGLLALLACHGFSAGAAWGTAGGNSWMRESAIDLAVRQASDLRVPEEHGVSPMGAIDEGLGVVGRRLSGGSPVLCPTQQASGGAIQNDQSPYGEVTLTSPDGTVSLYDDVAGYASSLFCQWHIKPPGGTTSQLSLVFDKFDVPVGFDMLRVYQLKCTSNDEGDPSICKRRQRTLMLSFPTSFDEAGMLPPLVHMQESNGVPVHLTIRFTSRFASQSAGFVASRRRHVRRGHPAWIHRQGAWSARRRPSVVGADTRGSLPLAPAAGHLPPRCLGSKRSVAPGRAQWLPRHASEHDA